MSADTAAGNTTECHCSAASSQPAQVHYKTPRWFDNHIKTAEELEVIRPMIFTTNDTLRNSDCTSDSGKHSSLNEVHQSEEYHRQRCFTVRQETLDDLLDRVASLHLPDPLRQSPGRQCTIVLHTQIRRGFQFLDELVLEVAKELRCSLLSFSAYELHDISLDFYDQERSALAYPSHKIAEDDDEPSSYVTPSEKSLAHFFGFRSMRKANQADTRNGRNAITALIDAVKYKAERVGQTHSPIGFDTGTVPITNPRTEDTYPATLLYLRHYTSLDLKLSRRLVCRLRDVINERRMAGQRITFLVGFAHPDSTEDSEGRGRDEGWMKPVCDCIMCSCVNETCSCYECPIKVARRKLQATGSLFQSVSPTDVPKDWQSLRMLDWKGSSVVARFRTLQRRLCRHLSNVPSSPVHLLDPDCPLPSLSNELIEVLAMESSWPWSEDFEDKVSSVLGRCLRKHRVDLADVQSILLRAKSDHQDGADEATNGAEAASAEETATKAWQEDLRIVEQSCNDWEKMLLSKVVSPGKWHIPIFELRKLDN
jgi:hypothetical protein